MRKRLYLPSCSLHSSDSLSWRCNCGFWLFFCCPRCRSARSSQKGGGKKWFTNCTISSLLPFTNWLIDWWIEFVRLQSRLYRLGRAVHRAHHPFAWWLEPWSFTSAVQLVSIINCRPPPVRCQSSLVINRRANVLSLSCFHTYHKTLNLSPSYSQPQSMTNFANRRR